MTVQLTPDKLNANFVHASNARVLGTAFQPSVNRPVLVSYTIELSVTSTLLGTATREVELRSDSANPPTVVRGTCRNQLTGVAATNLQRVQLSCLIAKGDFVNLVSVNSTGTGTITIISQDEVVL